MRHLFGVIFFFTPFFSVIAQLKLGLGNTSSPSAPKEYIIKEIKVTGTRFYDASSFLSIISTKVGDNIKIPGNTTSEIIKKLMDQGILEDVKIIASKIENNRIWLEIQIKERPRLYQFQITGIRKGQKESVVEKINTHKGKIITEAVLKNIELALKKYYQEKGYFDAKVVLKVLSDTTQKKIGNNAILNIDIQRNNRVKINRITFEGNTEINSKTLRRKLKDTREKKPWRIFSPSKFISKKYEEDKEKLINFYGKNGFRDARILRDTLIRNPDQTLSIHIHLFEGKKYKYRNIKWEGNYIHSEKELNAVLGVKKGDIYNVEELEKRLNGKPEQDVSSLYMDDGYLFFNIEPEETRVEADSIDITFRVNEGKQFTINKVLLNGNTKTSDHVALREIRTLPGQKFNKTLIIRTVRELSQLGYFNPEKINPVPQPKADGTVDIEYNVEEKPSDQIELSGGWGGLYGFTGTAGVTFNNFSVRNLFNFKKWRPLPAGDGQKLSFRYQSTGRQFNTLSLSFQEPWLGGRKPHSFGVSLSQSFLNIFGNSVYYTGSIADAIPTGHFNSTTLSFSLGRRLRWPDDFFSLSHSLTLSLFDLNNYPINRIPDGRSLNINLGTILSRNSTDQPIFPRSGSSFTLNFIFTPPYSLLGLNPKSADGKTDSRLVEYNKLNFDAAWNHTITGKLVLNLRTHMGFLGRFSSDLPITSFERFVLGGSGMQLNTFGYGFDIIGLRGYEDQVIGPYSVSNTPTGGVVFNKFVAEVRYPVSLNPSATIYILAFAEGGNNWGNYRDFNPFKIRRSMGFGARIFMPAFGMIGIDYGQGLDPILGRTNNGLKTFTFTIGQQFR